MNDDSQLAAFEVTDLMKLFDMKSTENPSKVLYHFILKLAFKCDLSGSGDFSQLLEAQSRGALTIFSQEEASLIRNCLRETIDQVQATFEEIVGIKSYLEDKRATLQEEADRKFLEKVHQFLSAFEERMKPTIDSQTEKFNTALRAFMAFFCESRTDKVDKIVQTLLDFSMRHDVSRPLLKYHFRNLLRE
jgi:hypothetical protein